MGLLSVTQVIGGPCQSHDIARNGLAAGTFPSQSDKLEAALHSVEIA